MFTVSHSNGHYCVFVPMFTVNHSNGHYSVFGGGRHVYSNFNRHYSVFGGCPYVYSQSFKGHYSVIGGGPYVFITTNLLNLCPLFSATRTRKNQQTCVS